MNPREEGGFLSTSSLNAFGLCFRYGEFAEAVFENVVIFQKKGTQKLANATTAHHRKKMQHVGLSQET